MMERKKKPRGAPNHPAKTGIHSRCAGNRCRYRRRSGRAPENERRSGPARSRKRGSGGSDGLWGRGNKVRRAGGGRCSRIGLQKIPFGDGARRDPCLPLRFPPCRMGRPERCAFLRIGDVTRQRIVQRAARGARQGRPVKIHPANDLTFRRERRESRSGILPGSGFSHEARNLEESDDRIQHSR